jgi:hypothetical protein
MLCINDTGLKRIEDALCELLHNREHLDLDDDDRELLVDAEKACAEVRAHTATEAEREAASGEHGCDEIEIDDCASASRAEDRSGYWVSAWVWVDLPTCEECSAGVDKEGDLCADCKADDDEPEEAPLDTPSLDTSFHDHEMDVGD